MKLNRMLIVLLCIILLSAGALAFTPATGQAGFDPEMVSSPSGNVVLTLTAYPNIPGASTLANKFNILDGVIIYDSSKLSFVSATRLGVLSNWDTYQVDSATSGRVTLHVEAGLGDTAVLPAATNLVELTFTPVAEASGSTSVALESLSLTKTTTSTNGVTDINHPTTVTLGSSCGDGNCDAGESCTACSADCGVCPPPDCKDTNTCALGDACNDNADCGANVCTNGVCAVAPTCTDDVQNQDETGIDCGGSCPACPSTCTPSCPLADTICSGTTYTQDNGCGTACNVVGTKTDGACVSPTCTSANCASPASCVSDVCTYTVDNLKDGIGGAINDAGLSNFQKISQIASLIRLYFSLNP